MHLHPFDPSANVSRAMHYEYSVENGNKQKHDQSSTDEIPRDLDRLAASIRWIQRAEAATRRLQKLSPLTGLASIDASDPLPRAPQLLPASGPIDAGDHKYRREMLAPHSLKPERLMPPPTVCRGDLFWPISILLVLVLAAPIAYYFLLGHYRPISTASVEPQLAQPTISARDDALMARAEGEIPSAPCR
jgi:hypothetical protein